MRMFSRPVVPICGVGRGETLAWVFLVFAVFSASPQIAQAQQPQPWKITPSVSISETFTDNVDLDPDGDKDPALITTLSPGLDLSVDLKRVSANLSGSVDLRHQALSGEDFDVEGSLSGFTNVEWFESLLFTDFRASISQELLQTEEARSGSDENTRNLDTVENYQVSPYLTNRLGDYADSDLRYQFGYSDSRSDSLTETYSHDGAWNLTSGSEFTTLLWSTGGSNAPAVTAPTATSPIAWP